MTEVSKSLFNKEKYDKVIQFKLTNDSYEFLVFAAKKLNMSMSEIIREALFLYLNSHN